jgi:hypothetical protein
LKRVGDFDFDFLFVSRLRTLVRARLEQETANYAPNELRRMVHEIIDREIGE